MNEQDSKKSVIDCQYVGDLPDLPEDMFLLVLDYLHAWDVVRCQMVSKKWRMAFTNPAYLRIVLSCYPKAREMRVTKVRSTPTDASAGDDGVRWQVILNNIASRYFHLTHGKARILVKHKLRAPDQTGHWYPIGLFDYHESQPSGRLYFEHASHLSSSVQRQPYLFLSTLWSYDDGMLVYAPANPPSNLNDYLLSILDVDSNSSYPVPFSVTGRVIRNLRLKDRTLVIEWAEKSPFHDLTAQEKAHRHFATCFDIRFKQSAGIDEYEVTFRSEWKLHFLGLPLSTRDRFFSTHNGTHYAVYFWLPNRSMYTGDEDMPIESLFVWDITKPSTYLPSTDPGGKHRPTDDSGPRMISRFSFRELDFLGVRQHSNISIMSLRLDSASNSLTVRGNTFVLGQGYFDPAERLWCATTTTFPFIGHGPCLQRIYDGELPPYRGQCSMESSDVLPAEKWLQPIMDVYDEEADVRLSLLETCFTGLGMGNSLGLRAKLFGQWTSFDSRIVREVGTMGRIAGDERWLIGQNGQMELVIAKFY